jgi:hypothetical protein
MTTTDWTVTIEGVDFTSDVLSLSLDLGRKTFFDDWNGGKLAVTIRNQNSQCENISQFNLIRLQDFSYWYVIDISFNDTIAVNGSTCTVTAIDPIRSLSQYFWDMTTSYTDSSLQYIYDTFDSTVIGPPYMDPPGPSRALTNNDGQLTGASTLLNFFSSIMLGECGAFYSNANTISMKSGPTNVISEWDFVRDGGTGFPYYELDRMAGTELAANVVTVNYQESESTFNNVTSGNFKRNYTRYTQLLRTIAPTQAEFYAKLLSQKSLISGSLSWMDSAADSGANTAWANSFSVIPGDFATLEYALPGDAPTTTLIRIEGFSCQANPQMTTWKVHFTDASLFGFILNSESNGVLGGTGIYYNSQINYDEVGYTYNDNVADNGSRLGW